MEGPSLVIATEELRPFEGKKVVASNREDFVGSRFLHSESWGKHLILHFSHGIYRIHFLMFGSYRIDDPRENRVPKLLIRIGKSEINFYSCAIKELSSTSDYDWTVDTMSAEFSSSKAVRKLKARPEAMVCDVLMDQEIFAGVGNIIKNEVLFLMRLHPKAKMADVPVSRLVSTTVKYCRQFYDWKKAYVLKRNWKIMRKKKCPVCGGRVTKAVTGKLKRVSHYCSRCQEY